MKTIDLSREVVVARGAIAPPFFAWLAMAVSAIVVYTLTASAPPLGATTWQDAARLGTGWWMTTLGGATSIGGRECVARAQHDLARHGLFDPRGVAPSAGGHLE
ncbi:hypothetical protein CT171_02055 [Trueperella pyogenes]|uniref:hypothetical protein n=1 Tax=Trueperella pyogenes TaxID=1661 RepID=UPI000C1B61FF|nr:hypothetical protein [Trueperella pyogenes]PIN52430.1 hypothetical protein CT171_02055 [Trueperella pyogenes]